MLTPTPAQQFLQFMSWRITLLLLTLSLGAGSAYRVCAENTQPLENSQPNVLIWLMDDVGFAQVSRYGGLIDTPNIDRVARMGLIYTNYHTAPICSAARASLLTGRMPHSVHIGGHATAARNFPGYDARIPASAGTLAANLREAGYLTAALGKWDHLPNEHASSAGPFFYWPTNQGFEQFYGFLAADADNWHPTLINGTSPADKPLNKNYHLSSDLADQAIAVINTRYAVNPRRPFFIYWATGIAHAPHHAPKDWIKRYEGKFDMGWDKLREIILERQKTLGIIPEEARLAERPAEMPAWDSLSDTAKRLYRRQMEVFAASLSHTDAEFGRILDQLQTTGELDNTIIIITSDNGASAEGGPNGLYNEAQVVAQKPSIEENIKFLDTWGGPETFPHYAYGWAVAGNTPFRYYKQTTHEGGTRVPLIVAWPNTIKEQLGERNQFVHVSDIAPTLLEAAGVPLASHINNVVQQPMEGSSFTHSFIQNTTVTDNRAQYVELYGNKGLWWKNWSLVTSHRYKTWDFRTNKTFDEPWELYDLSKDPGQTNDLSNSHPETVKKMAALFDEQAKRYNVYPLHNLSDTSQEAFQRAQEIFRLREGKWRYPGAIETVPGALAPPVNFRDFTFSARLQINDKQVTGPVFAYGGQLGGMGLYLNNGKPVFIINSLDGSSVSLASKTPINTGARLLTLNLEKSAAADGKPPHYRISIASDLQPLAEGELHTSIPLYFGIPETFGIGHDKGSPVMAGYDVNQPFPGIIDTVEFNFRGNAEDAGWVH